MTPFSLKDKKVWVAGHNGMVGAAIVRRLRSEACKTFVVSRQTADLRRQNAVEDWLAAEKPDAIFLAAALVGGIHANNTRPAEFLHDNLAIELNVIEAARRVGVRKLMLLGSSCIYPRLAPQPMKESALLTGPLEPTNEWYAIAKIAGIKLCQAYRRQYGSDFISLMPTNLYGPGDNFDLEGSHVVPGLMRKMHDAKLAGAPEVVAWGTGSPLRELLHVDDLADACVHLMESYSGEEHVNVGSGEDITIRDLAGKIAGAVRYTGRIHFDTSRPDGAPRKLLDIAKLTSLGWRPRIGLDEGLAGTYRWFQDNIDTARLGQSPVAAR